MEYYLRPVGRVILGGLLPFFLVLSAIVAVPLARHAFPVALALFILFHAVLGAGIWQESMLDVSEVDIQPGRWWPALAGLDVTCLSIGSLVSVLYIAPHWLRTEAHGAAGRYIALGAGLQALGYLMLLARSGWRAVRQPSAEWIPVPAWPPVQPRPASRAGAPDAIRPRPAPPSRARPGWPEKAPWAVCAAATTDLPFQASRLQFGWLAQLLAGAASLAAIVLALRQLNR